MAWINTINFEDADAQLKRIYNKVKGPNNNVDNVLTIHSLRPHTLTGHMSLYKNVLHHSNNKIPKWFLETIGVYVSSLNSCNYCVEHHYAGLKRLLNDDLRSGQILNSIRNDTLDNSFDKKHLYALDYAKKITLDLKSICENDILILKESGYTDGEILEINQVVSYFNYVNRSVVGLGVNLKGDIIGLSPNNSNDPDQWNHK
jgi:uncharacterized peroxidase-related enzyme